MRVITLDENKEVIGVKNVGDNYVLNKNDIVTDLGELGQIKQSDGSFMTPQVEQIKPKPTLEEQIEQLKQDNVKVMKALADIYENLL